MFIALGFQTEFEYIHIGLLLSIFKLWEEKGAY